GVAGSAFAARFLIAGLTRGLDIGQQDSRSELGRSGRGARRISRPLRGPIGTVLSTCGAVNRGVRAFESFAGGGDRNSGLFRSAPLRRLQTESAAAGAAPAAKSRERRGLRRVGRASPRPVHPLTKTAPPGAEPSKTPQE